MTCNFVASEKLLHSALNSPLSPKKNKFRTKLQAVVRPQNQTTHNAITPTGPTNNSVVPRPVQLFQFQPKRQQSTRASRLLLTHADRK